MSVNKEKFLQYLFYALVFLLPWQARYIFHDPALFGETWEYGRLSLYSWDILLAVLVLSLWPKIRNEFVLAFRQSRSFYFYLLFVSVAFITGAWSQEPLLVSFWGLRLLAGGFLWLIVKVLRPQLSRIFIALTLSGLIQAIWGFMQFTTQETFASKWLGVAVHPVTQGGTSVLLNAAGRWLRAYGGQAHPNVLGGLLVITSLATVWLFIKENNIKLKFLLAMAYAVQLAGLFVSFSRGAWLALLAALVVCWLVNKIDRKSLVTIGLISVGIFLLFGSLLWQPTKERLFGSSSRLEQQSLDDRVGEVGESKSLLTSSWWRGVGLGNYTKALSQYAPGLRAYRYQPVHNILLLILTELGIIGLGLCGWFCWQRLKEYPRELIFLLVPIAVTSLLDHYWWTAPSMMLLFWLLVVLPHSEHR